MTAMTERTKQVREETKVVSKVGRGNNRTGMGERTQGHRRNKSNDRESRKIREKPLKVVSKSSEREQQE